MSSSPSGWKAELLGADLDLRLAAVVERPQHLSVIARPGLRRRLVATAIASTSVFATWIAVANPYAWSALLRVLLVAAAVLPALAAVIVGCTTFEKSFDRVDQRMRHRVACCGRALESSRPLSAQGRVRLLSHWEEAPCWSYRIAVDAVDLGGFSIEGDYPRAIAFARRLAEFLDYEFVDATSEKSRS